MLTRLPTFTRTPLPSLMAMLTATPSPVAIPAEPAVTAAAVAPLPTAPAGAPAVVTPSEVANPVDAASPTVPAEAAQDSTANPSNEPTVPAVTAPGQAPVSTAPPTPTSELAAPPPVAEAPIASSTPTATATATPLPTDTPAPAATETPSPTSTTAATPTETPLPQGWSFAGVKVYTDQYEDSLLLYGNLVNNTGVAQELLNITGIFYDAQGQVMADEDDGYSYRSAYVIPAGGSMPFELIVDDIDSADKFVLAVEAEPSGDTVQHEFEFSDLNQWNEDDLYCLEGRLRNPGDELEDYLLITAILYDAQDNVVNFSDYEEFGRIGLVGDATSTFEICVSPPNQDVARYELQAWGQ